RPDNRHLAHLPDITAVCREVGPPGFPSCLDGARDTGLLPGRSGLLQYAVVSSYRASSGRTACRSWVSCPPCQPSGTRRVRPGSERLAVMSRLKPIIDFGYPTEAHGDIPSLETQRRP